MTKNLLSIITATALYIGYSNSAYAQIVNVTPIDVTSCSSSTGINKIVCLADAFKSQLTTTQVASLQLTYSLTDAKKWSNLPQQLLSTSLKRVGIGFNTMTSTQISYAKALIKELAGNSITNEGWSEIEQILNSDNYLYGLDASTGAGYGAANYYISFLGTPATTGKFAILFGGHHLGFQNTYVDGVLVSATPSFRGVEPVTFTYNSVYNEPLEQEKAAFLAVLNSLSTSELASAKLSPAVTNLVAGPQQDDAIPTSYSGIPCSSLTTAQQNLVLNAIKTYVTDVADYSTFLATYESELSSTYISYSGNSTLTAQGDYFRIHGPSIWIEWALQGPVAATLTQPHVHSVWRDIVKDYGQQITSGVNETVATYKISVYPNPTNSEINISFPHNLNNATITIFDIAGKIVKQATIEHKNTVNISVDELQAGNYIITIIDTNNQYTAKFIKK